MEGEYAEAVKCLALGLPKIACKILWNSDAKSHLKDIIVSHLDCEMKSFCSTSNPSILRDSTHHGHDEMLQFSLEKFDEEIRAKAPVTNDVLESLCLSARQKRIKRTDGELSTKRANKALCVKITVCSMMLNCRCPQLSALSKRIGMIVRHSGASRTVSFT